MHITLQICNVFNNHCINFRLHDIYLDIDEKMTLQN